MEIILIKIFCLVDDFCQKFYPKWQKYSIDQGVKKRNRLSRINPSEIITIIIFFHTEGHKNFKQYYTEHVLKYLTNYFNYLPSYSYMVRILKHMIIPLYFFLKSFMGEETAIYFIDSTTIEACHVKRTSRNKVFAGMAKKSKSTMGWFYGFKLHLIINDKGELMNFLLTPGNVDDRKPVSNLTTNLMGKIFGDRGYISQNLFNELFDKGLELVTRLKTGMKTKLISVTDKILLRKRSIIETVNGQLKNISQIEHTRHRSVTNFFVNILGALTSYALKPKKPSIKFTATQKKAMFAEYA